MKNIWHKVLEILRKRSGQVFAIHIIYASLGVILFTPLAGIVGQTLLHLYGQPALADMEIAWFLLSPFGMLALILFSALLITIAAFEQATMITISAGTLQGLRIDTRQALYSTARHAPGIFSFVARLVVRVLIMSLPFLAAAAAIAWFLLTDHDINYYLAARPPVFLAAAGAIGLVLLTLLVLLIRRLLAWSLALPLILLNGISPARAFAESEQITRGNRRVILAAFAVWVLTALLLGATVMGAIHLIGSMLVPRFPDSIRLLALVLGGLMLFGLLVNLLISTFTAGSLAALQVVVYRRYGPADAMADYHADDRRGLPGWWLRMTLPRLALVLTGCTLVAALAGLWLLNGIQTNNDVLIVAHRGAAGKAPENTLASIRQAIQDGTDWVEIDVQETADGEVVVIHDSDFMKLAGVDLKVWDGTLEQVRRIDIGSWFAPAFSAERVPTLAEVLNEAKGRSRVVIELKYYGHDQQLEQRVVDIVEQAGMADDVAIMSLKYDGIRKIRRLRPDWTIGLLSATAIGNLTSIDADFLAVNTGMATSGFIRQAQQAGKQVFVWTINDPVTMSRMMSLGADGIITDEPEMARKVFTERAGMSSIERLLAHTAILFGQPVPARSYRDQSP